MQILNLHIPSAIIGAIAVAILSRLLSPRPRKRKSLKRFKRRLYAKQNGKCNGCKTKYELKDFTIDHIKSVKRGGGDEIKNLQLLCHYCNSLKGDRTMTYLRNKLRARQGVFR